MLLLDQRFIDVLNPQYLASMNIVHINRRRRESCYEKREKMAKLSSAGKVRPV